jgi:hypothetical protein
LSFEEFSEVYISSGACWYNHPEYYGSLAKSTSLLYPYYIAAYDKEVLKAIMYMQVVEFPMGSLLQRLKSGKGVISIILHALLCYLAKFKWLIASYGNLYFIPDTGCLFDKNVSKIEKENIVAAIHRYIEKSPEFKGIKAFMFSNITEEKKHNVPNCFGVFEVDPVMVLKIRPNWQHFNDYLEALSSKYRVRLKKVLQVSKPIISKDMTWDELQSKESIIYHLYKEVAINADFNISYLGESYFTLVKKTLPDKFFIQGYYIEDKLIGFVSYFLEDKQIHIHYMGMDYTLYAQYKLYNRMLSDFVRIGIENQVKMVDFGRTATEIKSTLGAIPQRIFTFIKFNNKLLNLFLTIILRNFEIQPYIIRNPFRSDDE